MPAFIVLAALIGSLTIEAAAEEKKDHVLTIAGGKLSITASGQWTVKKPAVRIIEHELVVPKSEGDVADGRMLMMSAGGSIEANLTRWFSQFSQPDGKKTKDRAIVSKLEVAGRTIHIVDVSGTYSDRRGPFAPAVKRADYRMLAAIVSGGKKDGAAAGNYYIKFYGPKKTVAANEKAFTAMIESLKVAGAK
jgi:hypothetical protein